MNCRNDYSLPEVIAVRVMDCADLPKGVMQSFIAGVAVFVGCTMTDIPIFPGAKCQGLYVRSNGGAAQNTTLEFRTKEPPRTMARRAFAVKTAGGEWYLIGSHEQPWPKVEVTDDLGTAGGDPAVKTVKVTFESLASLIPVAVI